MGGYDRQILSEASALLQREISKQSTPGPFVIAGNLCICSTQSEKLHNLEIVLLILRILSLCSNLEIEHAIWRLHNTCTISRSHDLHAQATNFELLPVHLTVSEQSDLLICKYCVANDLCSAQGNHPYLPHREMSPCNR